jgi:hypothetical protein
MNEIYLIECPPARALYADRRLYPVQIRIKKMKIPLRLIY